MTVLSKLLFGGPTTYNPTCYDVGHIWDPSCVQATLDIAHCSVLYCLKIYITLYGLHALIRRKGIDYFMGKYWRDVGLSTLHLSSTATLFMTSFCISRILRGRFRPLTLGIVPTVIVSTLTLQFERDGRKGTLVLYMLYQALECIARTALKYDLIKPLRNAEIVVFSVACSGLAYFFRLNKLQGIQSVIQFLLGPDEVLPDAPRHDERGTSVTERSESPAIGTHFVNPPPRNRIHPAALIQRFRGLSKHQLCKHKDSCISYCLKGSTKLFGLGVLVQMLTNIKRILRIFSKSPKLILKGIGSWKTYQLSAFLVSLSILYKSTSCVLRWATNCDSATHGVVAGLVSGLSMLLFRSYTISVTLLLKLLEVICHTAQEKGYIPLIPYIHNIIYGMSVGIAFHGGLTDPKVLNPSYWKFLLNLTDQKFALFDRGALQKATWGDIS